MRKNWLTAVMVIAYKYPYGHDEALVGEKIVGLLRIIIHTLAAQSHVCDRFSKPVTGLTMRSRDLSSIGGETDQNLPDDNMFEQEGNFSKLLFKKKIIYNCFEFLIYFFEGEDAEHSDPEEGNENNEDSEEDSETEENEAEQEVKPKTQRPPPVKV